ncbi:copper resistance D family protein [Roseibium sp.]|uniref:copper resistance D family protein n=1 Tax=Roseibium sp. TaxID=1936156 RepID=UPI003D150BE0
MLAALAAIDAQILTSIAIKTLASAATLLAAGSVLVSVVLRSLTEDDRTYLARVAGAMALIAAVATLLRIPLRASFLMGGTLDGAFDPMLLELVADSPLGGSVLVRLVGLILILGVIFKSRFGLQIALGGALVACLSFAFRGHTLEEPRLLLGTLITLHMICLAFWLGVFGPLLRSTNRNASETTGEIAEEFGKKALWSVWLLVIAGGILLGLFGVTTPQAFTAPYGQLFLLKLALFAAVIAFAALNKLRLTPALLAGNPQALPRLKTSIRLEAVLVISIFLVTATVTTITSPN